ncbi:nuclear transport factor 2 family protein [Shewanella sp.]|uniref:nuclear transport factor 2 family protein n=1 Tax=Shewanella sp. TaxID=50422 RepID=UPI0035687FB0
MKNVLSILFFYVIFTSALAANPLTESELKGLTQQFIEAKNQRQQPNSNEQDIDHFLSFLADDVKDEHIKFNVTVTSKEELRSGLVSKLKDKIYFSNIDILEIMVGRNVALVKFKEHAKGQPGHMDKPIEYTAVHIFSLEFNDHGKIKHIRRHHGL